MSLVGCVLCDRVLKVVDAARGAPLIVQRPGVPVIRGVEHGVDVVCPACESSLLLENVTPGSIWEVAFRCGACGSISCAPALPPGSSVPAVHRVVPATVIEADGAFVTACDEAVVAEAASERRAAEMGLQPHAGAAPPTLVTLDGAALNSAVIRARIAFAPILKPLERKFSRGPAVPHRLPQLLAAVGDDAESFDRAGGEIDVISFLELQRAVDVFEQWARDPFHSALVQDSATPATFLHNVLLLWMGSVFRDSGLAPEFIPTHDGRSADLRLRISARRSVDVELKSPLALQRRPGEAVEPRDAAVTIEKTLKDARGQLRGASGGVLVIGGALWNADMDEHAQAAAALLRRNGPAHVIGVILAATTIELQRARGTSGFDDEKWHEVDWRAASVYRWVENPKAQAEVRLNFQPGLDGPFDASFGPVGSDD